MGDRLQIKLNLGSGRGGETWGENTVLGKKNESQKVCGKDSNEHY